MDILAAIATNTLRQTVRQRLFYNILFFGVGLVILAMVVSNITFGFPDRVVRSIGLSGVTLATDLMALLIGVNLIHQEIDRKTLFVVLTRPVHRWQYVTGRYLGLVMAVVLMSIGLAAVFVVVLVMAKGSLTHQDAFALAAAVPEACILGAVGLVLSSFSTPTLGTGLGIGVWLIGASTDDFVKLTLDQGMNNQIAQVVSYAFPALARLNFRDNAVYSLPVSLGDWSGAVVYAVVYVSALIALASAILSRREMV